MKLSWPFNHPNEFIDLITSYPFSVSRYQLLIYGWLCGSWVLFCRDSYGKKSTCSRSYGISCYVVLISFTYFLIYTFFQVTNCTILLEVHQMQHTTELIFFWSASPSFCSKWQKQNQTYVRTAILLDCSMSVSRCFSFHLLILFSMFFINCISLKKLLFYDCLFSICQY